MVMWLRGHLLACDGPTDVGGLGRQWTCEKDQGAAGGADKTIYRVLVTAGLHGLVEISAEVDQTANADIDIQHTQGFLADTVGGAPAVGDVGAQISVWVDDHIDAGGGAAFGRVQADLTPFGPVTKLRLGFADPTDPYEGDSPRPQGS